MGGLVFWILSIEKSESRETHLLRNVNPEFTTNAIQEALLRRCVNHTLFYLRAGGTGVDEEDGGFGGAGEVVGVFEEGVAGFGF